MNILNISVIDKVATYQKRNGAIVCGNSDYQIKFTFDEEWGVYPTKTARFIYDSQFTDVVFTGDTCEVPIMQDITLLSVGVFAGNLITTTPALIPCVKSILCENGTPVEPTPDVYAQIMELLNSSGGGGGGTGGGADGEDGEDGATFTPSVSSAGVISWTNDKGLPNPDPVNIKGPRGYDGNDGASVYVDEMYDTDSGVYVSLFDGSNNQHYSFTINHGKDGADGKSAYEYAKEGGFNGSEAIFGEKLNETTSYTASDLRNDLEDGIVLTERAVMDRNNHIIDQTYATKAELANYKPADDVPDYVKTEAESVIDRVIAAQGNRTFTFATISDLHYGNGSYTDGIKHACQAMKYIDERIKLDAVAVLGDYTDNYPTTNYDDSIADFKAINAMLSNLRFAPNMRIRGNHDFDAVDSPLNHRYIYAYSDDVVWGDRIGGYFYKDFSEYKIRVICLNTVEGGEGVICSTEQYKWFINSLDLTSKEDAEEWQILALSHHPLDWWTDPYVFAYVLDAYQKGTSWTNGTITCDFTGKNKATFIGNIHGHIHNFKTDYIHLGNVNGGNKSTVWRMATPNACYDRENQYTESSVGVTTWVEDTTYSKTQNSADDTSFCIYCIDLDTYTIKAIVYGAGYDREVVYHEPSTYTNQIPLSINADGTQYVGENGEDGYKVGYRINSSGNETASEGFKCTGFIPVKLNDVVYLKNIAFSPTGGSGTHKIQVYDASFGSINGVKEDSFNDMQYLIKPYEVDETTGYLKSFTVSNSGSGYSYIRVVSSVLDANSIITINEPIE